jgi:hypothetical protein
MQATTNADNMLPTARLGHPGPSSSIGGAERHYREDSLQRTAP